MSEILAYVAAAMPGLWGVAHVIPTDRMAAGLAPISSDAAVLAWV